MIDLKSEDAGQMQLFEREDIDDEEDLFEAIDKLISLGSNAGDVKKLQDAGIYTCNGLMMQTKKNLTGIKGLSEAKVDKICEAAEKLVNFGYVSGNDVLLRRKSVVKITTGSQALDELLGGGIETLCITEAFGEFRSGKTQLDHTLCVSTQLPINMRGGNGKVAYNDTEGTFRPDRIVPTAERFGMDAGAVFDNIIYGRAYTYQHQYNLLLGLAAKMAEEPFRLLIVDSVIALFRVDFTGRGELAERQQKLAQMLSRLTKIAEEFNVAVYMNNQVIADPDGGMFISDPKKPAGGHVLAHAATIRLIFRKRESIHTLCVSTQLPVEDSDEYNGHQEDEEDYEEDAEEHEDGENESHSDNDNDEDSQGSNGADEMEDFEEKELARIEAEFNMDGDSFTVFYTEAEFEDNFGIKCYAQDESDFLLFAKDCVYQCGHKDDVDVSYLNQDGNEVGYMPLDWYQNNNLPEELFVCHKGFLNEIKVPNVVPVEYFIYQTKGKHKVIEETHSVTTEDLSLFATLNEFMEHLRLQKFPLLTPRYSYSYYYGRRAPDQKRFFLTPEEKRCVCVKQTVTKIRVCPLPKRRVINRLRKDSGRWMGDD